MYDEWPTLPPADDPAATSWPGTTAAGWGPPPPPPPGRREPTPRNPSMPTGQGATFARLPSQPTGQVPGGSAAYPLATDDPLPGATYAALPAARGITPPATPSNLLRARQRVETSQSALSELNVLNEQLIALPDRLRERGVAREQREPFFEALTAFTALAGQAWEGLAADDLDRVATTAEYRQSAVAASRRISRLQQEAAVPRAEDDLRPVPGPGLLWRPRVHRVQGALVRWREGLRTGAASPDLPTLGGALEALQAALGLAGLSTASFMLHRIITITLLTLTGLIAAIYLAAGTSALTLGSPVGPQLITIAAVALAWYCFSLWMQTGSNRSLWWLAGAARWRMLAYGSRAGLTGLGIWRWFWSLATLAALVGMLVRFAMGAPRHTIMAINSLHAAVTALAGPLLPVTVALLGLALVAPPLIHLPASLSVQIGLARDLAGFRARLPAARATLVSPALGVAAWNTAYLLTAALLVIQALRPAPFWHMGWFQISWFGLATAIVVVGVYLLAIEGPYRLGLDRWRQERLDILIGQKHDLNARLNRLDDAPPAPDDVGAIQYEVTRLQYVQLQESDLLHERAGPFRPRTLAAALAIILVVALLLDSALMWIPMPFPR